jgi:hypothetical protein
MRSFFFRAAALLRGLSFYANSGLLGLRISWNVRHKWFIFLQSHIGLQGHVIESRNYSRESSMRTSSVRTSFESVGISRIWKSSDLRTVDWLNNIIPATTGEKDNPWPLAMKALGKKNETDGGASWKLRSLSSTCVRVHWSCHILHACIQRCRKLL